MGHNRDVITNNPLDMHPYSNVLETSLTKKWNIFQLSYFMQIVPFYITNSYTD